MKGGFIVGLSISVLKLQCVNSATRGRIILLSPATSLCLDMEKISHHHLQHLSYTYCRSG